MNLLNLKSTAKTWTETDYIDESLKVFLKKYVDFIPSVGVIQLSAWSGTGDI
jgi:hypothetical protein